jgi:hypothetical protein
MKDRCGKVGIISMAGELADRTLAWSYIHNAETPYTVERFDSYALDQSAHFYYEMSKFIRDGLDELYAEYSEEFNLADYPDVEGFLSPTETNVFLKGAGAADIADVRSINNHDRLPGLFAVIRHRLDQRSLEQIKSAADLFNWTIACGLAGCDSNSCAVVRVGSVEEIAPLLLDWILYRIENDPEGMGADSTPRLSAMAQRFLPFVPLLTMIKETVMSENWVQNQLAIRIFFWIANMYDIESDA